MNKKDKKKLLVEIMEADSKDGLYKQQTVVEWLAEELKTKGHALITNEGVFINVPNELLEQAIEIQDKQRIKDYNAGYDDAKCNHINDAENYVNESNYIKNKQ